MFGIENGMKDVWENLEMDVTGDGGVKWGGWRA